jgi:hypothetical protein
MKTLFITLTTVTCSILHSQNSLRFKNQIREKVSKQVSKSADQRSFRFTEFNSDSSAYIMFSGIFMNDTVINANVREFKFNNKEKYTTESISDISFDIIIYTPCTNHQPNHVKESNPKNNCIWGQPIVVSN